MKSKTKDKPWNLENSALHVYKESMLFSKMSKELLFSEMSIFYMSSIVSSSKNHRCAHLKKKNSLDGYLVYSGFISFHENSKDCEIVQGILEQ